MEFKARLNALDRVMDVSTYEQSIANFRQEVRLNSEFYQEQGREFHLEMLKFVNGHMHGSSMVSIDISVSNKWAVVQNIVQGSLPAVKQEPGEDEASIAKANQNDASGGAEVEEDQVEVQALAEATNVAEGPVGRAKRARSAKEAAASKIASQVAPPRARSNEAEEEVIPVPRKTTGFYEGKAGHSGRKRLAGGFSPSRTQRRLRLRKTAGKRVRTTVELGSNYGTAAGAFVSNGRYAGRGSSEGQKAFFYGASRTTHGQSKKARRKRRRAGKWRR